MYRDMFKDEHNILRESLKRFVANEIVPHVDQWKEEGSIPKDLFTKMGKMGYLGIPHPVEYGGSGGGHFHDPCPRRGDRPMPLGRCHGVGNHAYGHGLTSSRP